MSLGHVTLVALLAVCSGQVGQKDMMIPPKQLLKDEMPKERPMAGEMPGAPEDDDLAKPAEAVDVGTMNSVPTPAVAAATLGAVSLAATASNAMPQASATSQSAPAASSIGAPIPAGPQGGTLPAPLSDSIAALSEDKTGAAADTQGAIADPGLTEDAPAAASAKEAAVSLYTPKPILVHFRVPNWDDLQMWVDGGYTARTVKMAMEAKWGIRGDNTRLWFKGQEIPQEKRLSAAGVEEGAIVNVVVRCSKGKKALPDAQPAKTLTAL